MRPVKIFLSYFLEVYWQLRSYIRNSASVELLAANLRLYEETSKQEISDRDRSKTTKTNTEGNIQRLHF